MSRACGDFAEQIAVNFLTRRGFTIIERNISSRFGEIDIIAHKNSVLHFIEVKSLSRGNPVHAMTPKKFARILKTIDFYLAKTAVNTAFCVDLICISGNGAYQIDFFENISL